MYYNTLQVSNTMHNTALIQIVSSLVHIESKCMGCPVRPHGYTLYTALVYYVTTISLCICSKNFDKKALTM